MKKDKQMRRFFNLLALLLMISGSLAAQCLDPTPKIIGDFYGCAKDTLLIRVDTFTAGNTYAWSVTGAATVFNQPSGVVKVLLPNVSTGSFTLTLTETTPGGCSGSNVATLRIETNSSLVCDDNVFISLNQCRLIVTPDLILEGQAYPNDSYDVTVRDLNGTLLPSVILGNNYINKTVSVSIKHRCSGNSCWGYLTFEDKLGPEINCPEPVTVSCFNNSTFPVPTAVDNCDLSVPVTVASNELTTYSCDDDYAAVRIITYTSKDKYGNVSEPCLRYVYYEFEDIDSIKFPLNRDDVQSPAFTCENDPIWDKNKNGYPEPDESGFPTLFGNILKQDNGICKINAVYTDQKLVICESSFKIIRKWTILDWCTGQIIEHNQIIKVLDKNGPVVTCAPDFAAGVYTNPYTCLAEYTVPAPTVIYDCSGWDYTIAYLLAEANGLPPVNGKYVTDNVTRKDGKYTIKGLPKGLTWLKYTITDNCGNSTECFSEVYVQDNIPPVAVCDQTTVVSLTNGGYSQAHANTFDDGSHDNCGKFDFEVARMVAGCNENTNFKPHVIFCCEDVGKEVMVQLRVWDDANCNGIFGDEIDIFTDTNGSGILGDVVNGIADRLVRRVKDNANTCMVNVKVQDKANPIIKCPAHLTIDCQEQRDTSYTGVATAVDNCPGVRVTFTQSGTVDQCGKGTITRTWFATDNSNNTASCVQRINVVDNTPFRAIDINWNTVPNRTLNGCSDHNLDPSVLGRPTWKNDECSLVAASYTDQRFDFVDSVCVKILRKWTIIDWCTFNDNNPTAGGKYEYIQVIKINNTVAPVFESCKDVTICIQGANCQGNAEVLFLATDDCTPVQDLKFSYRIDLNNDGSIDRQGITNNASGIYEPGKHKVFVTVTDGCGNYTNCTYFMTIKDCKKPTPYCYSELVTVVMNDPVKKTVTLWAKDFNLGSFDNCPGRLRYSFSSSVADSFKVFTCDQLGIQNLEMWVTDAAGNQDFCKVRVDIQDNSNVCPGSNIINGVVLTQTDAAIQDVEIVLTETIENHSRSTMTNNQGRYALNFVQNQSYELKPNKVNDILNGVSTLDLVLIQRHILGTSKFDSPYKLVAADVNNNKSVTAADLVALRKVILGMESTFPSNQSWRFVDKAQQFSDPKNPWPLKEIIQIPSASGETITRDFVGIKVGDVNQSAKANADSNVAEPRSSNPLETYIDNKTFSRGDVVKVTVKAAKSYNMYGLQNTFNFDNKAMEFLRIEPNALDMGEDKVGVSKLNEGLLATSWSNAELVSVSEGDALFTLYFKALDNGNLRSSLWQSSELTKEEVYDENMAIQKLNVEFRNSDNVSSAFLMAQNSPNPFKENTTIVFEIGRSANVTFKITDLNGKLLQNRNAYYEAGRHSITVSSTELKSSGIFLYTIETDFGSITKKMVVID